jgi:hypothetical protein
MFEHPLCVTPSPSTGVHMHLKNHDYALRQNRVAHTVNPLNSSMGAGCSMEGCNSTSAGTPMPYYAVLGTPCSASSATGSCSVCGPNSRPRHASTTHAPALTISPHKLGHFFGRMYGLKPRLPNRIGPIPDRLPASAARCPHTDQRRDYKTRIQGYHKAGEDTPHCLGCFADPSISQLHIIPKHGLQRAMGCSTNACMPTQGFLMTSVAIRRA